MIRRNVIFRSNKSRTTLNNARALFIMLSMLPAASPYASNNMDLPSTSAVAELMPSGVPSEQRGATKSALRNPPKKAARDIDQTIVSGRVRKTLSKQLPRASKTEATQPVEPGPELALEPVDDWKNVHKKLQEQFKDLLLRQDWENIEKSLCDSWQTVLGYDSNRLHQLAAGLGVGGDPVICQTAPTEETLRQILSTCIYAGYDINALDRNGKTPLDLAIRAMIEDTYPGASLVVKELQSRGAKRSSELHIDVNEKKSGRPRRTLKRLCTAVNAKNAEGSWKNIVPDSLFIHLRPIRRRRLRNMAHLLSMANVPADAWPRWIRRNRGLVNTIHEGKPLLHHLIEAGLWRDAVCLLKNGANPALCNNDGESALHVIARSDHELHKDCPKDFLFHMIKFCSMRGADLEGTSKAGETPMQIVSANSGKLRGQLLASLSNAISFMKGAKSN